MFRATLIQFRQISAIGLFAIVTGNVVSAGCLCEWRSEHSRPWYNPSCEPNWGHHPTNWRRFPTQYGNAVQGSYCPDGSCNAGSGGAFYQGEVVPGQGSVAGAIVRPAPPGTAIVIQKNGQPQLQPMQNQLRYPTPADNANVFSPPVIPSQSASPQTGVTPSMTIPQSQPVYPAPSIQNQPGHSGAVGAPLPVENGITPQPSSTLNPAPSQNSVNPMPVPMPMNDLPNPMPPMPSQTSMFRLPFNFASQSKTVPNGTFPNQNQPPQQYQLSTQYQSYQPPTQYPQIQQQTQLPGSQPTAQPTTRRSIFRGISFGRAKPQPTVVTQPNMATQTHMATQPIELPQQTGATQTDTPQPSTAPVSPFAAISRLWSRGR